MTEMLRRVMTRHRAVVGDAAAFALVMSLVGSFLFLFDLQGTWSADPRVDLDELLVLGLVLAIGLVRFCWRRIREQEREIDKRIEVEGRVKFLDDHDQLTGLPNRRQLRQALDTAIRLPPRAGTTHALLLLDLNGFKAVNDAHGHARGDEVLSAVAALMASALPAGELLARTGSDEFAIVLRDACGAEAVADRATQVIDALALPIAVGPDTYEIGICIGIALVPMDGSPPQELLRRADLALGWAKRQRRAQPEKAARRGVCAFAVYQERMDLEKRERDELRDALGQAIADGAIAPFYQPIVDLETGTLRAFEALARWTHPILGDIPPDRFIPLAEETGQIRELSDQLLACACADACDWPASIGLSFNISPLVLRDQTFGLRALAIIGASGLPLRRIELEIAESAVTRDIEAAREVLGALREAGLRIALDDFGTGATSLAHLRTFKFDAIKIDRHFVDLMLCDEVSAAIVTAIVDLANKLDLKIVAEGIEEPCQSAALVAKGCHLGQGFLFGRAVPAEDARKLVGQRLAAEA